MSAKSVFERMHNRLFSRLGEQAFLRGADPCLVNMEYGVVVNYEIGDDKFVQSEVAATVDVANIQKKYSPAVGQTLQLADATGAPTGTLWVIDAIASDNGFMQRCILRG